MERRGGEEGTERWDGGATGPQGSWASGPAGSRAPAPPGRTAKGAGGTPAPIV